jgi:hypothetical protein
MPEFSRHAPRLTGRWFYGRAGEVPLSENLSAFFKKHSHFRGCARHANNIDLLRRKLATGIFLAI